MKCWICQATNWESFGDINPERELLCCKDCGALAYRVDPSKEEEIKNYYRHHYRPAPNIMNLITTGHKRAYIELFLKEFLATKTNAIIHRPMVCGDVGCATGYIPHWLRSIGHKATACELTMTYRRFAEHFYGVPVTEELETKHRYDLITIYHVLEHLMEPDKKLAHYVSLLAPGGHILVSVPEWLDTLEESSGSLSAEFSHLFHKDHINVFTSNSIKNLFNHAGLEIVKEDHAIYGQTYLLRKGENVLANLTKAEDYVEVMAKVRKQKEAMELFSARKTDEAIRAWPKYPDAWVRKIHEDFSKDRTKQSDTFLEAFKVLPDNLRLKLSFGTWLYMGEELESALKVFHEIIRFRPNEDIFVFMGWAYAKLNRNAEAIQWFGRAAEMNPMKWGEAMNAIAKCAVSIPCWEERAEAEAKSALFKKFKPVAALADPLMEGVGAEAKGG